MRYLALRLFDPIQSVGRDEGGNVILYLPPDISYGIECATECFDITADVCSYFHNFNDTSIAEAHDALDVAEISWDACHRRYADLYTSVFDHWFQHRADEAKRVWCLRAAGIVFGQKIGEKWDYLYGHYVSNCIVNHYDAADRGHMQRFLLADERFRHSQRITQAMVSRINSVETIQLVNAFVDPERAYIAAQVAQIQQTHQEIMANSIYALNAAGVKRRSDRQKNADIRVQVRKHHKVLKKSSSFLSRLIGSKDAVAFFRGDEIEVVGARFTFRMKKQNLLTSHHGGFQISVIDRTTDERLIDLCWYIPETPAVDQLAALVMMVKTGDEEEILRVGNYLRVTQSAKEHDILSKLKPEQTAPVGAHDRVTNNPPMVDRNAERDRTLHLHAGTHQYIADHAAAYIDFVETANSLNSSVQQIPDVLRAYFAQPSANEIRVIEGNHVTETLQSNRMLETQIMNPQEQLLDLRLA